MHRLRNSWNVVADSIKDILDFWGLPFRGAVGYTVLVITAGLGIDAMFNFVAYLYDRFWLGQDVTLGNYYSSHYWVAVLIVLIPIFLYLMLHESAKAYKEKRKQAELYTLSGIEIQGFNPNEKEVRPAGILVTNKKGIPISCYAQIEKLWQGKKQIFIDVAPLVWYENGHMKNSSYTQIKDGESDLIVLEHIRDRQAITVIVPEEGEDRDLGKWVQLEGIGITVWELESCTIEVRFFFTINGLSLKADPLRFRLICKDEALKVEKTTSWS